VRLLLSSESCIKIEAAAGLDAKFTQVVDGMVL